MSQQNGIATLLKAEKEAHEIVSQARKYRTERLKQAKLDAAEEINSYKLAKDKELKDIEQSNEGGIESLEKDANANVQSELEEIKKISNEKKAAVIKLLADSVTSPTVEVHANAL
ncbi:hypothetical protein KAFR_0J00390 [Kazachstania africana CBS 2517]|uniref:V-type proton ATPase subunit G n=1 Tax=Kazachstania africana (strain ATCC 22294 / BCRC 22015 / CBS 2517 / CECT 1963 / NBRC 1671 / NRRL Y-8276) TaxID=1071382 RepID=H2B0F7_KAZAF|nr:hypothetical protein KAFR_0J00390 [Kazachstania africana CBS 2517]CCF60107.1 hypothetical protein KAFR_0J00390 [Kazachstania africana CBS 2517]